MDLKNRHSIRLKKYDYCLSGAYFITICTQNKTCIFGEVINGETKLSKEGHIIKEEWLKTEAVRSSVRLDQFVVMPNHFHGVLWIVTDDKGTARCAPTVQQFGNVVSKSLSAIIRGFKSAVTKHINVLRNTPGAPVWQRNFYEHVIRDDESLNRITEYIINNSQRWNLDRENPCRQGEHEFYSWLASFKTRPTGKM